MSCNQRMGLLVLGYFKLVFFNIILLGVECNIFLDIIMNFTKDGVRMVPWTILTRAGAIVAFLVIDISFCVLLLIGSHEQARSFLRVYFWYAIPVVVVTMLLSGYGTLDNAYTIIYGPADTITNGILRSPGFYVETLWLGLVNIVTQICLLVFVRKEIRKLQNDGAKITKAHTKETELHNI